MKRATAQTGDEWGELVAFKKLIQLHGAHVTVAPATHLPERKLDENGAFELAGAVAARRGIDYDGGSTGAERRDRRAADQR